MLVTVEQACGNAERRIEPMQCRAVPMLLVRDTRGGLAITTAAANQDQVRPMAPPCAGPRCMHWSWETGNGGDAYAPEAPDQRGFCGFSGP